MNKFLVAVSVLLLMTGCASSTTKSIKLVISTYDSVVFSDGISEEEAKIIAQRALIKQNLVKIYDLTDPKIVKDVSDLPNYDKYWFVSFREKKYSSIEFIFMALINKDNGKLKFADDYKESKRWILEAALLGG